MCQWIFVIMDLRTRVIRNVDSCMGNIIKKAASIAPEPVLSLSVKMRALIASI